MSKLGVINSDGKNKKQILGRIEKEEKEVFSDPENK